jgi:hypothetical protein
MSTPTISSARREKPRTTVGVRCVAVFYLFQAFLLAFMIPILVIVWSQGSPPIEIGVPVGFGVTFGAIYVLVAVGLLKHHRLARWAAVATSFFTAVGGSVIGIAVFMYLIRPEHDGHFS